jgi:HEAT repeat protein
MKLEQDADAAVRGQLAVLLAVTGETERARLVVDAMVSSSATADRAAGLDAAARVGTLLDPAAVQASIHDPSARVRAAALRATAIDAHGDLTTYIDALEDHSLEVRTASVAILKARADALPTLIATLGHGSDRAQHGALSALEGRAEEVRTELLEWAGGQVRRAAELRGHALALADADPGSTQGYLGDVIGRRERAIEARLLQALAILGAPEASGLIRRCLHAPDPEIRAQAIEAIDSIGDPGLAREVVRLLDRDAASRTPGTADALAAAGAMRHDPDVWVRALALRTLSERLGASYRSLMEQVRDDPDPLIREAVTFEEGSDHMPQALQLVRLVDRMLVLRRVPLFSALEPEDLQRVAVAATEQSWGEGEVLIAEGDIADELVVIVEGAVRVVHRAGEAEQYIRTFGEGDHIGELAVLREAPRAASVIADPGGVRGLVIDGQAVQALLRERPDAAMAMLATLAERISQQA